MLGRPLALYLGGPPGSSDQSVNEDAMGRWVVDVYLDSLTC